MEHRFDILAKALAGGVSRREALRRLGTLGGSLVALWAGLSPRPAWATTCESYADCPSGLGCVNMQCAPCTRAEDCSSGDTGLVCDAGTCVACSSDSECTVNASNVCIVRKCASGQCAYSLLNCEDGDACTTDSCNAQSGCVHEPINCDDNNACTADACDSISGCTHTPIDCSTVMPCDTCSTSYCDPMTGCGCRSSCTAGQVCSDGVCCPTGQVNCGSGTCSDLTSDSFNCGTCGNLCTGGTLCVNSQCVCSTGQTLCSGTCYNLQTDPQHCGACANTCTAPAHATATCGGGVCGFTCGSGYTRLGGACCASTQVCGSLCCPAGTVGRNCKSSHARCVPTDGA